MRRLRTPGDSAAPPAPSPYGPITFAGAFAGKSWTGHISIVVSFDGRTVTSAYGIAPGTCEDEEFGTTIPGRDGASGAEFRAYRNFATRIGNDGSFSRKNVRTTRPKREPRMAVTFSITGTFDGNVVRGHVDARTVTEYDACTANAAFSARRVR